MNKYPLVIINNEKVFNDSGNFYCENYDIKTLTEGLNEYHPVTFIARNSSKRGNDIVFLQNQSSYGITHKRYNSLRIPHKRQESSRDHPKEPGILHRWR